MQITITPMNPNTTPEQLAAMMEQAAQLLRYAPGPSWFTLRDDQHRQIAEVEITEI